MIDGRVRKQKFIHFSLTNSFCFKIHRVIISGNKCISQLLVEFASANRSSLNPGTLLELTTPSGRNAHRCTYAAFEKTCLIFFQVCHIFLEI